MDQERQIKRLLWWNRIWLSLLLIAGLAWWAHTYLTRVDQDLKSLRARWDGEILRLGAASDGPFIVTHLVNYSSQEGGKSWAALPKPIVIIDSAGASLAQTDISNLNWHYYNGERAPVPPKGAHLTVLYYRPLTAK